MADREVDRVFMLTATPASSSQRIEHLLVLVVELDHLAVGGQCAVVAPTFPAPTMVIFARRMFRLPSTICAKVRCRTDPRISGTETQRQGVRSEKLPAERHPSTGKVIPLDVCLSVDIAKLPHRPAPTHQRVNAWISSGTSKGLDIRARQNAHSRPPRAPKLIKGWAQPRPHMQQLE